MRLSVMKPRAIDCTVSDVLRDDSPFQTWMACDALSVTDGVWRPGVVWQADRRHKSVVNMAAAAKAFHEEV